ncbi:MAG: UDP-2,3-diacylglucosamine diphosphatase [Pseudarcicella sp.]|nr:UDP-2,3-diacylglucosamine diphosphatase [Pseudarcicella sp.]MBP6410057.1 UDP-2,3-diacylglucosamine diphosphatase [Pseudarcicella sp.]
MLKIKYESNKKIYFASDFHLGSPNFEESLEREKKIVRWLNLIEKDAQAIFLLGDIFDFWFEYQSTVPKGFTRLLGKIASMSDNGIQIIFFTGNHDLWMKNYFVKELGVKIYHQPTELQIINSNNESTNLYLGHGDGLGPGDNGYKLLKKVFLSPISIFLFGFAHPTLGIWLATKWSGSRKKQAVAQDFYNDKEYLFQYALATETQKHHDIYLFGHRHLVINMPISENSKYINLGEWFSDENSCHYGVWSNNNFSIERFESNLGKIQP